MSGADDGGSVARVGVEFLMVENLVGGLGSVVWEKDAEADKESQESDEDSGKGEAKIVGAVKERNQWDHRGDGGQCEEDIDCVRRKVIKIGCFLCAKTKSKKSKNQKNQENSIPKIGGVPSANVCERAATAVMEMSPLMMRGTTRVTRNRIVQR